jgi:hypothetical protein
VSRTRVLPPARPTAVIDRLERAGFVKRRRDSNDRRVVLVEVPRRLRSEVAPLYRSLQEDLAKVNGRYTNRDLAVVARYMTEALEALARHVEWLQTQPVRNAPSGARERPQPPGGGRAAAPVTKRAAAVFP